MERIEIKSQSLPELKQTMESLGEKGFRAKQRMSGCTGNWQRISMR